MYSEKQKSILKWVVDSSETTEVPLSFDADRNVHFQKEVRVKKYRPAGRPNDIKKKQSIVSLMESIPQIEEETRHQQQPRVSIESMDGTVQSEVSPDEMESISQQVSYRDNIHDKDTLNLRRGTAFPGQIRAQLATMDEEDDTYIESDSEMMPPRKAKETPFNDDRSIISGSFPIESYSTQYTPWLQPSFDYDSSLLTGTLLDSEFEPIDEYNTETSGTEVEVISTRG